MKRTQPTMRRAIALCGALAWIAVACCVAPAGAGAARRLPSAVGSMGAGSIGIGSASTEVRVRLTARLQQRVLVVEIRGPAEGMVQVCYVAMQRTALIASGCRCAPLRAGRATVTFTRAPNGAIAATFHVRATFAGGQVLRTVRRASTVARARDVATRGRGSPP
jgi:hypothetical protein